MGVSVQGGHARGGELYWTTHRPSVWSGAVSALKRRLKRVGDVESESGSHISGQAGGGG